MPFTEGANDGALNGTTEVTLVAAPSSGVRRVVRGLSVYNRDTASVTLTVRYKSSSTRVLWSGALASGETWELDGVVVLDATTKSLAAVLAGAAASANPEFVSSYADVS